MPAKWTKPDPDLVARFDAALPQDPAAERKTMFGYPACFVNGHFFTGLHERNVVIRLPGGLSEKFPALRGAGVFDPMGTGKGMKDWWIVPAAIGGSEAKLAKLLADAFEEVSRLPPKEKKPKKASKAAGARRRG